MELLNSLGLNFSLKRRPTARALPVEDESSLERRGLRDVDRGDQRPQRKPGEGREADAILSWTPQHLALAQDRLPEKRVVMPLLFMLNRPTFGALQQTQTSWGNSVEHSATLKN